MRILVISHQPGADRPVGRLGEWLEQKELTLDHRIGSERNLPKRIHYSSSDSPDRMLVDKNGVGEGYAGLIINGGQWRLDGSDGGWWLPHIRRLLHQAIYDDIPTLAICLGHQLLAEVVGGTVSDAHGPITASDKDKGAEYGLCSVQLTEAGKYDMLFAGITSPMMMYQNHQNSVTELPDKVEVLAKSDRTPIEALRYGSVIYGLQFHPEVASDAILKWSDDKINRLKSAGYDWQAMIKQSQQGDSLNTMQSRQLSDNFARIIKRRAERT